jgi:hypothetical protein
MDGPAGCYYCPLRRLGDALANVFAAVAALSVPPKGICIRKLEDSERED